MHYTTKGERGATGDEACRHLHALTGDRRRFKGIGNVNVISALERNVDVYMTHHFTPGLPADNNVTENVIKQLNKKLRLMEGFQSLESAERYVRLLVGCYRFSASQTRAAATASPRWS